MPLPLPLRLILSLLRLRSSLVQGLLLPSHPALPVCLIPGLFNLMAPTVLTLAPSSHLISFPRLRLNITNSKAIPSPSLTGNLFIPAMDMVLTYSAVKVRLQRT